MTGTARLRSQLLVLLVAGGLATLPVCAQSFDACEIHVYDSDVDNPLGPFAVGQAGSFTLPQFNKTGWEAFYGRPVDLYLVEITVQAWTIGGYNIVDNETADVSGDASVTIGAEVVVAANSPAFLPEALVLLPQQTATGIIGPDEPSPEGGTEHWLFGKLLDADFNGPDSLAVTADAGYDANQVGLTTNLGPFIGNGDLIWDFWGSKEASYWSNLPYVQTDNDGPDYRLRAEVKYLFSVEPEPSSLALMAAVLGPVVWRRRRRKSLP